MHGNRESLFPLFSSISGRGWVPSSAASPWAGDMISSDSINVAGIGDTYSSVDTLTDEKWGPDHCNEPDGTREDDTRGSAEDDETGEQVHCQRGE